SGPPGFGGGGVDLAGSKAPGGNESGIFAIGFFALRSGSETSGRWPAFDHGAARRRLIPAEFAAAQGEFERCGFRKHAVLPRKKARYASFCGIGLDEQRDVRRARKEIVQQVDVFCPERK